MIRQITRLGLGRFVLLTVLGLGSSPAQATNYWKNSVAIGDWSTGNNWSATSAAGVDNAGAPTAGEAVNIVHTDGTARTVTNDIIAPTIGLLSINLTGAGATTNTLSMPSGLTANGIYVGGYNGSGATTGRGAINHTAGTVATGLNSDLVVGHGAGSTGAYTLSGGALVAAQSEFIGFAGTGTFNHSAGTNTVNASGVGSLDLGGFAGAVGTYNLSGTGALTVNAHEYVGDSGTGYFNHTGGTNTIAGAGRHLYLGFGATGIGEYVISGTAALSAGGNVIVGNNGTGVLVIQDQASVFITNSLIINNSVNNLSAVNLSGGTLRFNTASGINRVNYTAGTIQLGGNRSLGSDPSVTTLYGSSPTIPLGKALTIEGQTNFTGGTTVRVNGGTLTSLSALVFSGALEITNGGTVSSVDGNIGSIFSGSAIVSGPGSTWNCSSDLEINETSSLTINNGGTVFVGQGVSLVFGPSFNLQGGTIRFNGYYRDPFASLNFTGGTVQLAGNRTIGTDVAIADFFGASPTISTGKALVVEGTAMLTPSAPVTLSGGALSADTVLMTPGSRITTMQTSQVFGPMLALAGSVIDATAADLTVGDATKVNGFGSQGTLRVGAYTVTLLDANDVVFDSLSLTTLGSGGSPGTLAAANGLTLDFGGNVTGFGTVSTPNDLAKPLINNGHITGNSVGEPITLPGYVKGVGTFDNVTFTGTFAPGLSPTILSVGNITLAPTSTLLMELGGTTPGSGYDQLRSAGALDFDGTLLVSLINGFVPTAGQSFNLFDWISEDGTFDTLQLPTLAGLTWNQSQLYISGELSLAAAGLSGDYNNDGTVNAADYVMWRDHLGAATSLPNDSTPGVAIGDFGVWKENFGAPAGGGSAANAQVPEPVTLVLLIVGMLAFIVRRAAVS